MDNWVKARLECSVGVFFEKLLMEIREDVRVRMETLTPSMPYAFRIVERELRGEFIVFVEGNNIHERVVFTLQSDRIVISRQDKEKIEVFLTLCEDGECRATIDGGTHELWYVRKMALEDLFFRQHFPKPR